MKRKAIPILLVATLISSPPVLAFPGAGKMAREFVEAVVREYGDNAARELAELGGEKAVQETLEKAAREGGEELAEKLVRYGDNYGVSAFKHLGKNPKIFVSALDNIPEPLTRKAIYAIERNGDDLAKLIAELGPDALEVAARHPGVGELALHKLGKDAVPLARKLSESEFMDFARYMDDIAALPGDAQRTTLKTILDYPAKALAVLEKNPTVLKVGAGVAVAIVYKDGAIETVQQGVAVLGTLLGAETTLSGGTKIGPSGPMKWAVALGVAVVAICGGYALIIRARRKK